jgi:hypothetical protein
MRHFWIPVTALLAAVFAEPTKAQTQDECVDRISKLTFKLSDLLTESKPDGRCALAKWGVERHQELLKMYNLEPDACKKSNLGKKLRRTLQSLVNQHSRDRTRFCRRA